MQKTTNRHARRLSLQPVVRPEILQIIHPNRDFGTIITRTKMCDARYHFNDEGKDERALAFQAELAAIDGLKKAEIDKHEIHFERFEIFSWGEIFEAAMPIIERYFNTKIAPETIAFQDRSKMQQGDKYKYDHNHGDFLDEEY